MRMKKQNLWLLINTAILVGITVLFIVILETSVPKEPKDYLFGTVVELRNETNIEDPSGSSSYQIVDYKAEAYKGSTFLGTVYNVKIKNGYTYHEDDAFGMIELLVAIDPAENVKVQIVELNQSDWTVKGIQAYIYDKYQSIPYGSVTNIPTYDAADPTAGATATDSTGAIKAIIQRVVDIHFDLIVDNPLITLYGSNAVITVDSSFDPTTEYVTQRELVKNESNVDLGYVYTLTGTGDFLGYDGMVTGQSVTIKVAFDVDDAVIGVILPEELYGHTTGDRMNKIQNYLDLLIGSTIDEFDTALSNPGSIVSGVSWTKDLVDDLIAALVEEVN